MILSDSDRLRLTVRIRKTSFCHCDGAAWRADAASANTCPQQPPWPPELTYPSTDDCQKTCGSWNISLRWGSKQCKQPCQLEGGAVCLFACSARAVFALSRRRRSPHLISASGVSLNALVFCLMAPIPIFTPTYGRSGFARPVRFLLHRAGPSFYT